jgi:hypothetical protein
MHRLEMFTYHPEKVHVARLSIWHLTVTCMWSGGISERNRVRPAAKWAQGLTCQTAKTPACHIQIVCAQHEHVHTLLKALKKC